MTTTSAAPEAARRVRREWEGLSRATDHPAAFHPSMVASLPEPARRWLTRAVRPGTPLWQSVELTMSGKIRLGAWRPFTARQVLAPPHGFIWAAETRLFGVPVVGYDRFGSGVGEMNWRALGAIPVMSAGGPDIARSAAGRLAGETVLLPTSYRGATWTECPDPDRVEMTWRINGEDQSTVLHIGADGRLLESVMQRWGNPNGAPYGRYPFGVAVEEEATFAGVTIPCVLRAGWWWDTDRAAEGEFFQARITTASFR